MHNMTKALLFSAVVFLLAAVSATVWLVRSSGGTTVSSQSQGPYRGSEPPGRNQLPPFVLPRYDGGTVDSASLRGKVVLTTFVDTACTDLCPLILGVLGQALHQLTPAEHAQLHAIAFSVDPKADTRAHVRRFLRSHDALGELDYLVAPARRMQPVWKAFHVLPATETHDADTHSADVRIFDRHGVWVSTLNAQADLSAANVVHDIRQALRAGTAD